MKNTDNYLMECQKSIAERLEYLNHRIQQRKNLDEEIENLYDRVQWDFQYMSSLLKGTEIPPVSVRNAANVPDAKNAIPHKPEPCKAKSSPYIFGMPRPVLQLDRDGTVIQRFESGKAASRATGVASTQISAAANNNFCTKDGSFWRFEDNHVFSDNSRPVVVISADGKHETHYSSPLNAAAALGVSQRQFQIILHSITHKDEKRNLYYWYEDEYDSTHNDT